MNMKMEGPGEFEGQNELNSQQQHSQLHEDCFIWEESSQLYYHPRSGFYHDPNAGWYYSTRDGLYYKFEDGNYILLDSYIKGDQSEIQGQCEPALDETTCEQEYGQYNQKNEGEDQIGGSTSSEMPENHPPPSEWLEDTLIELYLSGYSNAASGGGDDDVMLHEDQTDERDRSMLSADGNNEFHGQGDGERNSEHHAATDSSESVYHEGASLEEERWQAQYGQVVKQEDESRPGFPVVDMWDWSVVREREKEGNQEVARIVGRLVQPSSKVHPSMPCGGRRLRTAPICKVHLDLVQVRSGQVYKLRSPNVGYLASLSHYDASNPTKDWGFPELSVEGNYENWVSKTAFQAFSQQNTRTSPNTLSDNDKHKTQAYRDRAAERRALHGGFGVAPGQKKSADDDNDDSSPSSPPEKAAAEALDMSFGAGSYAQKLLKKMGWKQGEALGKTQQGLREPLQGVGNKGTAGLGWDSRRSK